MIKSSVVIIGARSDIGRALARAYAKEGCRITLAGRGDLALEQADLSLRAETQVETVQLDINADDPDLFFDRLPEKPGTVIMVVGLLGDQAKLSAHDDAARLVMESNYNSPARYLLAAARAMQGVEGGCIIGISSVAGDRGRGSNFVYGSAKAGFTAFLSGLRNAHAKSGLHVMTVKPGFVATQMTAGMKLPPALTAQPQQVAAAILKAHAKRKDTIYVLGRWRPIMAIIRAIPEFVFKRLSL
jgi:decaprenylphospho-beta-D-erythro-pentofuranosid-2-ulose 2-reductase